MSELEDELKKIDEAYEKLARTLEESGLHELLQHVRTVNRLQPPHRMPIAYIGQPNHNHFQKSTSPMVRCKPTHLVLTDETAAAYDIETITIANVYSNIGEDPMPGELFSLKYYQDGRFLDIMAFDVAWITPANRVTVHARGKNPKRSLPEFRGILWCGVDSFSY